MEHKFRVWNKKEKWWFHEEWKGHEKEHLFVATTGRVFWFSHKGVEDITEDVEVFWWTGKKDKKGVEIYEPELLK